MTKIYCDKCEQPIDKDGTGNNPDQEGSVNIRSGRFIYNIATTVERDPDSERNRGDGSEKDIHICFYCRLDALNQLDQRE